MDPLQLMLQHAAGLICAAVPALVSPEEDDSEASDCLVAAQALLDAAADPSLERSFLCSHDASVTVCAGVVQQAVGFLQRKATAGPSFELRSERLTNSANAAADGFDGVIGAETAKCALREHVVLPLVLPGPARRAIFAGIRAGGHNVLLHGPPGTGKTTLARAAAAAAKASFFAASPSSVLSKYQGESERTLRDLFAEAKRRAPSVVLLDECDALAPSRAATDDVQSRRLLAELLLQVGGLGPRDRVVVLACTNRPEDCDPALLRRFHARVFVGPPGLEERKQLLRRLLAGVEARMGSGSIEALAARTAGWSGSDLESLCREAAMGPVRDYCASVDGDMCTVAATGADITLRPIVAADFDEAYAFLMCETAEQQPATEEEPATEKAELPLPIVLTVGQHG